MASNRPIAVIAGDIHYSLSGLELADAATRVAIAKANALQVPFIANGDTHDSKANLRGECVNRMIETFKLADLPPYVNVGNHCRLSERSEEHSLNFLAPYATVVNSLAYFPQLQSYIIPYYHDVEALRADLKTLPKGSRLIMHQGLESGNLGDYIQDASALKPDDLADFRTILSHYHQRQDIKCGRPRKGAVGLASYIGNPWSQSWGEAKDPEKGFQVLYSDGTLEFIPTNLRKHIVFDLTYKEYRSNANVLIYNADDLLKVKITGSKEELARLSKAEVSAKLNIEIPFKLDLIALDTETTAQAPKAGVSHPEQLDGIIDSLTNTSPERKERLKNLWKGLV